MTADRFKSRIVLCAKNLSDDRSGQDVGHVAPMSAPLSIRVKLESAGSGVTDRSSA
jgi:hypothetical protein